MTRRSLATMFLSLVLSTPAVAQNLPEILWSIQAHGQSVASVAFAATGKSVASLADYPEATVKLWSATDGSFLAGRSFAPESLKQVALAPSGNQLSLGQIVGTYPPSGINTFWNPQDDDLGASTYGLYAAYSPDGSLLATGGGGVGRYLDINRVSDGMVLQHIYHGHYVHAVAFSPDGAVAASAGGDNSVKLWDVDSGTLLRTLSGHGDDVSAIAFSPDGTILASGTGGWDDPGESLIRIWRLSDGELVQTMAGHDDWVMGLDFVPSGEVLISHGRDGTYPNADLSVRFWSVADGSLMEVWDVDVLDMAVAPDGGGLLFGTLQGELVLARLPGEVSAVGDAAPVTDSLRLDALSPNPLNIATGTRLSLSLPRSAAVQVTVHDLRGRLISTLAAGPLGEGRHTLAWDGRDVHGQRVASGVYLIRAMVGRQVLSRRVTLVK